MSAGKVRVEFSIENMDLSAAHGNVSYDKIKERVKKKSGLNVSTLNIAQVKRKYGIIERENYNFPKSENSKQPNCTPQKEKAILEALRYFGMYPKKVLKKQRSDFVNLFVSVSFQKGVNDIYKITFVNCKATFD